ncbi:MAG: GIN domain-containing protein [Nonlabens sp.]|uniref:GIN domain-containing protein n=1 Tax=Nonlabens sp. TaxID=1888209 RepID=UPI003EF8AAE5
MKKLLLVVLILTAAVSQAQEKVKGNREPSTVITNVDPFTVIEIGGDYEVAIVEGIEAQVEITTDSNLHQFLEVAVVEGSLSITSTARIRSKKEMTIRLIYPPGLTKIIAKDKAEISAITELKMDQLELEVQDEAKLFITADIGELSLNLKGNSKSELNLRGNDAIINFSDKASAKALLKFDDINLTMKGRTDARLEGDVNTATLLLEDRADYNGNNLVYDKLNMKASHNTSSEVNVKDELTLAATDDAKIELYNTPKVVLEKFTGKTQLIKK